jgi:hypothetical protein
MDQVGVLRAGSLPAFPYGGTFKSLFSGTSLNPLITNPSARNIHWDSGVLAPDVATVCRRREIRIAGYLQA